MNIAFRFLFWSALFAVVPLALVGATYSYSLSDAQLRAALTRPSLLIRVDGANRRYAYGCACDRVLKVEEIPPALRAALIAAEDEGFDRHFGVSPAGLLRALMRPGQLGGSTLTQQLAKFAITGDRNPNRIIRKLVEMVTALRIERMWSKDEIIALYLSRSHFGNTESGENIIGLRSAARVWFGREPQALSLAQSAILVAVLNATTANHPLRHPQAALRRARYVLQRMQATASLPDGPIPDLAAALPRREYARPFRDRYLEDRMIAELRQMDLALAPGFYRVIASVDPVAQFQARRILRAEVARVAKRRVRRAALVTLDARGRILALIGDLDYRRSQMNLATQARRQAASTAKLATYLAALEAGWRAKDIVQDRQDRIRGFVPRNYDRTYKGAVPLGQCLAESRNVCTMWLAQQLGFDKVAEMAQRIGMLQGPVEGASVVLGAVETTLLRNAAAYATLTNGGRVSDPRAVALILGRYGQPVLAQDPPASPPVLARETVSRMRRLLRRAVLSGTGHNAAFSGAEAFGKTGTSQENRDAWFIGFTSDGITTGIWVGPAEGETMRGVSGGSVPARIFARYNAGMVERFRDIARGVPLPR